MSMNLTAAFEDGKGRVVCRLNMYQSSTETTYKVMGDKFKIELTPFNYIDILKYYFLETLDVKHNKLNEGDIDKYQENYRKEKEEYLRSIAKDYGISDYEVQLKWVPTNFKSDIAPEPIILFGKILEDWQVEHVHYWQDKFTEYYPDYKCYLEAM